MLTRLLGNLLKLENHAGLKKLSIYESQKLATANIALHLVLTNKSELNLKWQRYIPTSLHRYIKHCCPLVSHGTVNRCSYCKAPIAKFSQFGSSCFCVIFHWTFFLNGVRFDLREHWHIFPQYICEWMMCAVKIRWSDNQ